MARVVTRLGDVFAVPLDNDACKCFLYAATDSTQLDSPVIKAFKETYSLGAQLDVDEVVKGEVEFHAHCVVSWGVKMGLWKKIGHVRDAGEVNVLFRDSDDLGDPGSTIGSYSERWYVWRINQPFEYVGKLEGVNREAEIGVVIAPESIVDRMRTGRYPGAPYPGY
jgi:hypothetical protein